MSVFKASGNNHIRKQANDADVFVPAGGATTSTGAAVSNNSANIIQLAADLYTAPALDNDGVPNLLHPVETGLIPVGTIIPHYDFNGLVGFNTNLWQFCDGSVVADASSSLNGQTLPDLSNRYLVGFGTEGGGDIDTATWSTTVVGEASHQVDLSHVHTGPSHTHNVGKYISNIGRLGFRFYSSTYGGATYADVLDQTTQATAGGTQSDIDVQSTGVSIGDDFISSASGTGDTSNVGDATQTIQPRSIRVRYIMRKR